MKHPSSQVVFAHWDERRGERAAPERGDINPVAIRHALSDTFMLSVDFVEQPRFRLAGTRLCALFCRELKGEAFVDLWTEESRREVIDLLAAVMNENAAVVAGITARTAQGEEAGLELLMLPVARNGLARIRAIGTLAPLAIPFWIGVRPVAELVIGNLRHVGAEAAAAQSAEFAPLPEGGKLRRGLVVYEGGREENPPPAA